MIKRAIVAHAAKRAIVDFGPIFFPGQIFLHPLRKKHSFLPKQICPCRTLPSHVDASQP
jgi:hypothetical protein